MHKKYKFQTLEANYQKKKKKQCIQIGTVYTYQSLKMDAKQIGFFTWLTSKITSSTAPTDPVKTKCLENY